MRVHGGMSDDLAGHEPPRAVPDQGGVAGASYRVRARKQRPGPRSNLAAMQSVLWEKRFGFAIRITGDSCCDRRASCAAGCPRIRIISPLHNRVQWDAV